MTVDAPPRAAAAAATTVDVNILALAAKDPAPTTPPSPFNYAEKANPPPAAPELHRAAATPDVDKLASDAEKAARDYFEARGEYQFKLWEIEALNDTPENKQKLVKDADRDINIIWKNAQRATGAYDDFVNSQGPSREMAHAEAWDHSLKAQKLEQLAQEKLDQLNDPSKPAASPAAIRKASDKLAAARKESIEAGKIRGTTSDAVDLNNWRITRARDLQAFARLGPEDQSPIPPGERYMDKGI